MDDWKDKKIKELEKELAFVHEDRKSGLESEEEALLDLIHLKSSIAECIAELEYRLIGLVIGSDRFGEHELNRTIKMLKDTLK